MTNKPGYAGKPQDLEIKRIRRGRRGERVRKYCDTDPVEYTPLNRADEFDWYLLNVQGSKVIHLQKYLSERGYATYLPAFYEWRFRNKFARNRMKKHRSFRPLMPSYLFIGLSEETPGWHLLMKMGVVKSIMAFRESGNPIRLSGKDIRKFNKNLDASEYDAPEKNRFMQTNKEFSAGSYVLMPMNGSAFDGWRGKVVQIDGPTSKVLVDFLGAERVLEVKTQSLQAA